MMKPKHILKESKKRLAKKGHLIGEEDRQKIERLVEELQDAIAKKARAQSKKSTYALRKKIAETMPKKLHEIVIEYVVSFGLAVIIALLIRHFLIEPFKIPTGSMIPTFVPGDYILVSKARYGPRIPFTNIRPFGSWHPNRWDIVVFTTKGLDKASQYPRNFVKRVVGLPGEEIEISDGEIYVNGELAKKTEWMKKEKVPFGVIRANKNSTIASEYILWRPSGQSTDDRNSDYDFLPQKAVIRDGKIYVGEKEVFFYENGYIYVYFQAKKGVGTEIIYVGKDAQPLPLSIDDDGVTVYINGVYYFNSPEGQRCNIETWKYRINFLDFHLWAIPDTDGSKDMGPFVAGYEGEKFTVPEGHYLMLGDNSSRSFDSRGWGFVPYENIKGKVFFKWWPPRRWGISR